MGTVCKHYVDDVFIPRVTPDLNASLAAWQPPFYVQALKEEKAADWAHWIKFSTPQCMTSLRKMICSVIFMKPYTTDAVIGTYHSTVNVTSYPDMAVCHRFHEDCHDMLLLSPGMNFSCETSYTGYTAEPLHLFPRNSQIVYGVNIPGQGLVTISAPSNHVDTEDAASHITYPTCPYGNVIPDELEYEGVLWTTGVCISLTRFNCFLLKRVCVCVCVCVCILAGCAQACPLPMMTKSERTTLAKSHTVVDVMYIFGACVILLNTYFVINRKKWNWAIVSLLITKSIGCIADIIFFSVPESNDQAMCSSNATPYIFGVNEGPYYSVCMFRAVVDHIVYQVMVFLLFANTIESWLKIVRGVKGKQLTQCRYAYLLGMGVLFVIWSVCYIYGPGADISIAPLGIYYCELSETNIDRYFYAYTLPLLFIYAVSVVAVVHFSYHAVTITSKTPGNTLWKVLNTYKQMFVLCGLYLVNYGIMFGTFNVYVKYILPDAIDASFKVWYNCVYDNFITPDNLDYLNICGWYPETRYGPEFGNLIFALILFGVAALLVINLSSNDVKNAYSDFLEPILARFNVTLKKDNNRKIAPMSNVEMSQNNKSRFESEMDRDLDQEFANDSKNKPGAAGIAEDNETNRSDNSSEAVAPEGPALKYTPNQEPVDEEMGQQTVSTLQLNN